MNRDTQLDFFQQFVTKEEERAQIPLSGEVEASLDYCEYTIRGEYDKNSKRKYQFKKRKGAVEEDFMRAFGQLSREDKIRYYIKNASYAIRIHSGNYKPPLIKQQKIEGLCYTRSYNIKRWKKKNLRLDSMRQILYAEKDKTIKEYDLGDYIFRASKNTDYFSFVLEAIRKHVHDKAKTVHIGFADLDELIKWSNAVQLCIDYRHWEKIYADLKKTSPPRLSMNSLKQYRESSGVKGSKKESNSEQMTVQKIEEKHALASSMVEKVTEKKQVIVKRSEQKPEKKKMSQDSDSDNEEGYSDSTSPPKNRNLDRTIIEDLIEGEGDAENIEEIEKRNKFALDNKKNLDFFHRMFPDFQLEQLEAEDNYEMVHNDSAIRIMQNMDYRNKFKVVIEFQSQKETPCEAIFHAICSPEFTMQYNNNITEVSIKTFISSQNSAIMYMSNKIYNKLYRPRDFVFLRHGFTNGKNQYFIVDKAIENTNFPPFITIVRGEYTGIWGVLKRNEKVKVVAQIDINNMGYLNVPQNTNLALNFLKPYTNLKGYVGENVSTLKKYKMFEINWDITQNEENAKAEKKRQARRDLINRRSKQMQSVHETFDLSRMNSQPDPKIDMKKNTKVQEVVVIKQERKPKPKEEFMRRESIMVIEQAKKQMQEHGEIDPAQLEKQTMNSINLSFDQKGFVIIDQVFRKNRYQLKPLPVKKQLLMEAPSPGVHPLWRGDWKHDTKDGGLLFINEKKIEDQKGVLKFVLSKIGKNLLSGKSVLNISLPVDIFLDQSNLELFIRSFGYAPRLLEPTATKNHLERFKSVLAFGLSMSPLYLNMEKPFNPILGETFQAWINGCPAYAEQISHHPPISALYFVGRGYRISAQLQAKVQLHMNSGCGTNEGIFRVAYDDGLEICYTSPGGEISGLTYGDRKFNLVGKAYCWIESLSIFLEVVFNPSKKGFFSVGKQENPVDYLQGTIGEVKKDFMKNFLTKRKSPTDADYVRKLGRVSGIWHKEPIFESESLLNYDKNLPHQMQYQQRPLPSDANWREDIAYRRLMQVPRAQNEKERLEVLQRQDRKLREKFKKK